jgi:hypothetical protein
LYDAESGDAKVAARRVVHVSDFHSGQVADFGMTKQIAAVSDNQSISQSPSASATEMAMMTTVVGTGNHSLALSGLCDYIIRALLCCSCSGVYGSRALRCIRVLQY